MLGKSISDDIKYQLRYGNMVIKLILANTTVFLFFAFFNLFTFLFQAHHFYDLLLPKLEMPATLGVLLRQPWSLITYMFLHQEFFHILFNMLWLYWFGEIFILFLGDKKVLPLYLLGGIAGAAVYVLAFNVIPVFKPQAPESLMLGASASIFAIVFAAATISPDYEMRILFLGNVKIKYVAVVPLLLDIISIPNGNAGGYLAHLGGALSGYLYIKALQSGYDITSPFGKTFKTIGSWFKRKPKLKVTHRNMDYKSEPARAKSSTDQQRLDSILDKISRSGFDSLTKEEKDFLFNYSKKS
jgi:membrane associated rhomboid family serine protease